MAITDPRDFGRVAVLMGGTSAEREVSLNSGAAVLAALKSQGVDAHGVDIGERPLAQIESAGFDRAFNVLHGRGGEDGVMQALLESLQIPYTGSGVLASALGMDKWRTKLVWQGAGLPVPAYTMLDSASDFTAVERQLGLPLFVKPAREGSSVGVEKVKQSGELGVAYREAARHDPLVIAEQFMGGGEYTVAILGREPLPVVKIEPAGEFYDYEAKYIKDDTSYLCPCGLAEEAERQMQQLALRAFDVLGCTGWGRVDILRSGAGEPYLLEVNTVPGMTDHSLVPMAAKTAGIDFAALVWRILETTLRPVEEVAHG
jgi:D-alanine-D-alanine ligase